MSCLSQLLCFSSSSNQLNMCLFNHTPSRRFLLCQRFIISMGFGSWRIKRRKRSIWGDFVIPLVIVAVVRCRKKRRMREKVAKFHCLLLLCLRKNLRAVLVSTLYPILRIKNSSSMFEYHEKRRVKKEEGKKCNAKKNRLSRHFSRNLLAP